MINLRKNLFPLPVLVSALLIGCSVNEQQAELPVETVIAQDQLEPSPSDPFAAIDAALVRMAAKATPEQPEVNAVETAEVLIWPRLVRNFRIASCPDDSSSQRWARWYADNDEYMQRVLTRARPWLHHIVNEIERRGLPGELALLPVVESAFDPFAYSQGRAAGPWQFLSGTAGDFGISINDWYDGRRDFMASTGAALDYLEYLAGLFDNDWALALAAYNAGQGRVRRAINRNVARGRGTAWHELPLPRETLGYVPKLNGLGCLFKNPEQFGFELPRLKDQPRIAALELSEPVDLVSLALLAGLDLAELVGLNPGLNRHLTPPSGTYHLIVPLERAEQTRAALVDLPRESALGWQQVRVRRGDSLSLLAQRHNTSMDALRRINGLQGDRLIAGQMIKLPGLVDVSSPSIDPAYRRAYDEMLALQQQLLPTDRFVHRVRNGESLWLIARRYGIGVRELQRMNGLGGSALIRPGQQLVIETGRKVSPPVISSERYVVRSGDSLWTISRQHRVALNDLMRWNDLSSSSILRPGQKLIIVKGSDA
ncbi:MAG: LysM peptidoglycan-binding domain-containing protein [Wenzhouxiangellaceae bacterium]|nr:LysM peptidoglycan-binding domain-containing protein [Wenzhouxiangellaceae bacterium]